jgi:ligand-binding sensor domain-containing protein
VLALIVGTYTPSIRGERLPIRTYNTTDGLPQDAIQRIMQDSQGYMWFGTTGGLSRFDGYSFVNYGIEHGLPGENVTDVIEARPGEYWVATTRGICRFSPAIVPALSVPIRRKDESSAIPRINRLLQSRSGRLWAGTDDGLFALDSQDQTEQGANGRAVFHPVGGFPTGHNPTIFSLLEDRLQTLWIGTNTDGLFRRWPDGHIDHFATGNDLNDTVMAMAEDRRGRLWAGTGQGLLLLSAEPKSGESIIERSYPTPGPTDSHIWDLISGSDRNLWLGTADGVYEFDGNRWQLYSRENGLTQNWTKAVFEDRDANLWIGSASAGVTRIVHSGITTFDQRDGFTVEGIYSIFETISGQLCATTGPLKNLLINCFDGQRFQPIRPNFPSGFIYFGWGRQETVVQDHLGEWWIATGQGLVRFGRTTQVAQLASMSPKALYTNSNGLAGNDVFHVFEDSRGDIWVSTIDNGGGLVRWNRSRQAFQAYGRQEGIPHAPSVFREDGSGNLWMGFYRGGIARFRDGHFTVVGNAEGVPAGQVSDLLLDHRGRLWVSTFRGGLLRIDDPGGSPVHFRTYTTAHGLSGNELAGILEDRAGRIYVSTHRGLDRIDPETDKIAHYTTRDGLATNHPEVTLRDHNGHLWFGSSQGGLSRLIPEADRPKPLPSIWIDSVQIGGKPHNLVRLVENAIAPVVVPYDHSNVQIDFTAISFASGDALMYQYQLEGADKSWSAPVEQHRVNYANLSPGSYRFVVRAINADSRSSPTPAVVHLSVLAPFWRRWWFIALCAVFLFLQLFVLHLSRIARAVALERIRSRIATDLHDDIGSSLSQVALLAEVVQRQIARGEHEVGEHLSKVVTISSDLIDSMTDIVWAINPRYDRLDDLLHRMRRFANDLCLARNLELDFRVRGRDGEIRLGPEVRRQVYLIFKESINNIARHSHATKALIEIGIQGKRVVLRVTDNGTGFVPADSRTGNGLRTMRERAASAGGVLSIDSQMDRGVSICLELPVDDHRNGLPT